jgi:hypothetical protein
LSDPFFKSEKWTNSNYAYVNLDGRKVKTREKCASGKKESQCLKNTAKCLKSHEMQEYMIEFCRARLLSDGTIELIIHDDESIYDEYLKIVVQKGVFRSQFWAWYKADYGQRLIWATQKQDLTLDRQVCRKGDVIKGRIHFECVQEPGNPEYIEKYGKHSTTIAVNGVFKTIVE